MATIKSFEDIGAWRMARNFSKQIFEVTNVGAFAKDYGLSDQINRASGSPLWII